MVSSAYGWAREEGLTTRDNPITNRKRPKKIKRQGRALTVAQQDLLIDGAATSSVWCLGTIAEVDAGTGARRGEVLALRWADYEDGRVTICRSLCQTSRIVETIKGPRKKHDVLTFKETKGNEPRVVGLPAPAVAALEAHCKRQDEFRRQYGSSYRADLDLIFANPDGTPLMPDSISSAVSALFKKLGIPKPKGAALHLLRHTHGSRLLAAGQPLPVVANRLGHDVKVLAEIYAHAIHGQDDEAVQAIEQYREKKRDRKLLQQ